ncbi:hypothetical protein [uncultured Pseudoteredinibacter sp.]|uniref:hypothetical protein n=1 Tax=uncultured Pseudoteredinibacter sp. TaxID=1641701 RepID=UPI0026156784|nr:hypothetical protein [uncultured Pseudoteredinibacter sp.]
MNNKLLLAGLITLILSACDTGQPEQTESVPEEAVVRVVQSDNLEGFDPAIVSREDLIGVWQGELHLPGEATPLTIKILNKNITLSEASGILSLPAEITYKGQSKKTLLRYDNEFVTFILPSGIYNFNTHREKDYSAKILIKPGAMQGHFSLTTDALIGNEALSAFYPVNLKKSI